LLLIFQQRFNVMETLRLLHSTGYCYYYYYLPSVVKILSAKKHKAKIKSWKG